MDSAVDIYIIHDFSLFNKAIYKEKRYKFVIIRDGSQYRIYSINTFNINSFINGDYKELDLVNIYYILNIEYNLLSLGTLERNSYKFQVTNKKINILNKQGELYLSRTRIGTKYLFNLRKSLTTFKTRANPLLLLFIITSPLVKSGLQT